MIARHLQIKNGYWYAVLNIRDEAGKQKPKCFATHLTEKGNKKRADEILTQLRIKHTGFKDVRDPNESDYICIDAKGDVIKPNYVSKEFASLLKRHNLRPIRFHDLRNSCANLLTSQRVPLIEVQQWLGHSTIATTADLYAHLDFAAKLNSAETIKKN